jgi:hypothetical protein
MLNVFGHRRATVIDLQAPTRSFRAVRGGGCLRFVPRSRASHPGAASMFVESGAREMSAIRMTRARTVTVLVCTSLVASSLPAVASETIRCSSNGYRYKYCRADTDNDVRMDRQHSSADCRQGYSWGYDRRGVWVDHGCDADFRVGKRGGHGSDKAVAAGAAIAGVAIIAALAAQGNKGQQSSDVPSWAVGTFSGYDPRVGADVELTILPGGRVSGHAGNTTFEGSLGGTLLKTERHAFRVERQGNGFVAVDERDANHRVVYRRSGGGY